MGRLNLIVNITSLDWWEGLTKTFLGIRIWSYIHSQYSELTVKLTSVIMVLGRRNPAKLLNNVVVGTGQSHD